MILRICLFQPSHLLFGLKRWRRPNRNSTTPKTEPWTPLSLCCPHQHSTAYSFYFSLSCFSSPPHPPSGYGSPSPPPSPWRTEPSPVTANPITGLNYSPWIDKVGFTRHTLTSGLFWWTLILTRARQSHGSGKHTLSKTGRWQIWKQVDVYNSNARSPWGNSR